MFTLEIGGRPVAMTKGNEGEARAAFAADEFKSGLQTKTADGVPLWNGVDSFRVREATPSEVRAFVQYAEKMGYDDEEEGEIVLYLQPVDTAEDFDESQDG